MAKIVFKRLFTLIPVLLLISIMTFVLLNLASSDAASILLQKDGIKPTPAALELKREELGLNRPLPAQYVSWLKGVVLFDFGNSYRTGRPVIQELMQALPATLRLTAVAFVMLVGVTIPLGLLSALKPNSPADFVGRLLSFVSVSMPSFWIGMLLLFGFAVKWKLVPVISNGSFRQSFLPAFTLMIGFVGSYIRHLRGNVVEILDKPYITAARAKGMRETSILFRHIMKNAMVPMITRFGMSFSGMLGGAAIIESIFSWPGLGTYVLDAIQCRDIPAVQGYVLLLAGVIVLVNLLVDLLYAGMDPRIKLH